MRSYRWGPNLGEPVFLWEKKKRRQQSTPSLPREDLQGRWLWHAAKNALPRNWIGQDLDLLFNPPSLWSFVVAAGWAVTVAHREGKALLEDRGWIHPGPHHMASHSGNVRPEGAYLQLETRDRVPSWTLRSPCCPACSALNAHPTFPTS